MEQEHRLLAIKTLNALIAGGYFHTHLIRESREGLKLDLKALRAVEQQLVEYYAAGGPGSLPLPLDLS